MKTIKIPDNWQEIKTILLYRFKYLESDDLNYQLGNKEKIYKNIEKKLNKCREEVVDIIASISKNLLEEKALVEKENKPEFNPKGEPTYDNVNSQV